MSISELMIGRSCRPEINCVAFSARSITARLRSGPVRRFDLVVGADGLHSQVRRLAFGPHEQFEKPLGYAVAAFEARHYQRRDPDIYMMHTKPGRMVGRFTLRDDRSLFLFVFTYDGARPATLEQQKTLLASLYRADGWEIADILQRLDEVQELYFDHVSQVVAPTWSSGRSVLVGDAAFCPSLLAGQGSALAIVAAYVLAGELARAEGHIEEAFAAYERRLRPYIATKQAGAARFASAFAPRTAFGVWFRNLVIQSFAIPGLAKLAVGREMIDRLRLPDYRLGPMPSTMERRTSDPG